MMVFQFRVLSDENDNFIRDYDVAYDMNLLDFHNFICSNLQFDNTNASSFFLSDSQWQKGREFTLLDMGNNDDALMPLAMESVTLGEIIHKNAERLIWMFDMFAERALYLELVATRKMEDSDNLPSVATFEGDAPGQFEPVGGSGSIFDDAFEEFGNFEGDDSYDDE